jgi:hypothetical protein
MAHAVGCFLCLQTMTEANSTPRWDEPGWDELPDAVKAAAMRAFLQRVGYDRAKQQHESEHRELKERISSLEHELQTLQLQLQRWIAAEQAATQQRIDAQRSQFH